MPSRRAFIVAALLFTAAGRSGFAQAGGADAFVAQSGRDLVAVVNGPGSTEQKKVALQAVVDRMVDTADVGRFCLGRYWRTATPAQQQEYLALFHRVLLANVTGHLGEYKGVTFTIGRGTAREGGETAVSSTVVRPGNAPNRVDWIVSSASGVPKIVDVVAEGTSLRLTQRNDYASFLNSHGGNVQALIDALRQQLDRASG